MFLKSARRSLDSKCKLDARPGQHGAKNIRVSDYGVNCVKTKRSAHLQRAGTSVPAKYDFGNCAAAKGFTGENLQLLESRLDNVVYRMGFGSTRAEARQLIQPQGDHRQRSMREHPVVPGQIWRRGGCA